MDDAGTEDGLVQAIISLLRAVLTTQWAT